MADQLPIGSLAVQTVAETERLKKQAQTEIPRIMEAGGEQAAKAWRRAFVKDAEKTGEDAGVLVARSLKQKFQAETATSKIKFAKGLIDAKGLQAETREAAARLQENLLRATDQLAKRGLLTDQGRIAIANQLAKVGTEGGTRLGSALRAGLRPGLGKVAGLIRVTLTGAIAVAGALVIRRLVQIGRRVAQTAEEIIDRAGRFQALERGFQELATGAGIDVEDLLGRLRRAAVGTASDFELMEQANFALQAGLPLTAEGMENLLTLARRLGKTLGRDTVDSFRRLTNGIAKNERRILDELGIIVSFEKAHKDYARSVGKTVKQLSQHERTQANLNAVLEEGERIMASLGEEELTAADRLNQLRTAARNVRDALALGVAEAPRFQSVLADLGDEAFETSQAIDSIRIATSALLDTLIEFAGNRTLTTLFLIGAAGPAAFIDLINQTLGGGAAPSALKFLSEISGLGEVFQQTTDELREQRDLRNEINRLQGLGSIEEVEREEKALLEERSRIAREYLDQSSDREEIEKRLLEIQKKGQALARARLRLGRREDEDPDLPTLEEIERAREKLREIRRDAEIAQDFGFGSISEAPEKLQPLFRDIRQTIKLQEDLQEALDTLGLKATGVFEDYLNSLKAAEEQQRQTVKGLIDAGDLLPTNEMDKAREKLHSLSEEFRALGAVGTSDLLADLPPVLVSIADEVGTSLDRLEDAEEALRTLGKFATDEERAFVKAQRRKTEELIALKAQLVDIKDILELFPGLDLDFLTSLDSGQVEVVLGQVERLAVVTRLIAEANADLEAARATQTDTTEPQRRLNRLLRQRATILRAVVAALRRAGLSGEELRRAIEAVAGTFGSAGEKATTFAETMAKVSRVGRGLLAIADAIGDIDENLRKSISGAVELADGLANLRDEEGKLQFESVIQSVGGALSIASGVIGLLTSESFADKRRKELVEALDRLRETIERQAEAILAIPGRISQAIDSVFSEIRFDPTGQLESVTDRAGRELEIVNDLEDALDRLREAGLSGDDIRAIAEETGLPLDNVARALDGVGYNAEAASHELFALQRAIDIDTVRRLFETVEGQIDILDRRVRLFDLSTEEALSGTLDILNQSNLNLPGDITTQSGRDQLEQAIQDAFLAAITDPEALLALAGDIDPATLFTLLDRAESLLDDLAEEAEDGATSAGFFRGASIEQFDRGLGLWQTMVFLLDDIARSERAVVQAVGGMRDESPLTPFVPVNPDPQRQPVNVPTEIGPITPPAIPSDRPVLVQSFDFSRMQISPQFPNITSGEEAATATRQTTGDGVERSVRRRLLYRGIPS